MSSRELAGREALLVTGPLSLRDQVSPSDHLVIVQRYEEGQTLLILLLDKYRGIAKRTAR